jgi:small subunit ribosomal protein S8
MLTDLVADTLTMIRNASMRKRESVSIPSSKMIKEIMRIFKEEGFIKDVREQKVEKHNRLKVYLKYDKTNKPVISHIKKVTTPGFRIYTNKDEIPEALGGLGVTVLTTPKGILTGKQAKEEGIGGEVICQIW